MIFVEGLGRFCIASALILSRVLSGCAWECQGPVPKMSLFCHLDQELPCRLKRVEIICKCTPRPSRAPTPTGEKASRWKPPMSIPQLSPLTRPEPPTCGRTAKSRTSILCASWPRCLSCGIIFGFVIWSAALTQHDGEFAVNYHWRAVELVRLERRRDLVRSLWLCNCLLRHLIERVGLRAQPYRPCLSVGLNLCHPHCPDGCLPSRLSSFPFQELDTFVSALCRWPVC